MTFQVSKDYLRTIHLEMTEVATRVQLSLRDKLWSGQLGGLLGPGVGTSIDFRDHRPYSPGDDPRYINWQAFARTEQYSMKLFQEEITPRVDLILDTSASMFYDEKKRKRSLELFYFCIASTLKTAASLRTFLVSGNTFQEFSREAILEYRLSLCDELFTTPTPPNLSALNWRHGSLRILISDLLYPGSPNRILSALYQSKGRGIVFAPYCADEEKPTWSGNVMLIDCETSQSRRQLCTSEQLIGYQKIYRRHFDLWQEECRKHAVACSRISSDGSFLSAIDSNRSDNASMFTEFVP